MRHQRHPRIAWLAFLLTLSPFIHRPVGPAGFIYPIARMGLFDIEQTHRNGWQ